MAEVRPFSALRYRASAVGDLATVLAPPYDVIDQEEQAVLHQRSPYNVVRLELGEARPDDSPQDNRYTRAAAALHDWRGSGVLQQDDRPALYVSVQEFEYEGRRQRRTVLFCRLRLEPWEAGVVRPHEETGAAAKEDRLLLLRHLRANVSPVLALYRDPDHHVRRLLSLDGAPLADIATPDGERHLLFALTDETSIEAVRAQLRDAPVYIADGHHRYETALAYREERRAQATAWTGEEPENFVLLGLTAVEDPSLVLLPIHRLVRPPALPPDRIDRLGRSFEVEDVTPKSYNGTALLRLLARLRAAGASGCAFGALGLEEGRLHLLTLRDARAVRSLMPSRSPAWQALDTNVLEYAVLRDVLGMDSGDADAIEYTEDAQQAQREVAGGRWPLAFLLNPTRVEQILAVADAGERMPRKSTYFHPKLPTGLVLYAFE